MIVNMFILTETGHRPTDLLLFCHGTPAKNGKERPSGFRFDSQADRPAYEKDLAGKTRDKTTSGDEKS